MIYIQIMKQLKTANYCAKYDFLLQHAFIISLKFPCAMANTTYKKSLYCIEKILIFW